MRDEIGTGGDQLLLAELRDLTARRDSPPASLTATCKGLFALRDLEAALRQLLES